MGILDRLAVLVKGDATGGVQALEQTASAADKAALAEARLATAAAKLEQAQAKAALVEAKAAGDADALAVAQDRLAVAQQRVAATSAEEGVVKATAAYKAAGTEVQNLEQKAGGLGQTFGTAGVAGAAGPAAIGAAAAAATLAVDSFVKKGVDQFSEITGQVRTFQRTTGDTAEDASRLVGAMNELGVDTDQVSTAAARLAKNLDGSQDKLAKHGVEIAKNKDGSINLAATFLNVADAVHAVGAGAEADQIALEAFGKSGAALLPILLRGRDGLKELFDQTDRHGLVFSQDDLEKGRQFSLAMKDLDEAVKGFEVSAGKELVPFLTAVVKATSKIVDFVDGLHQVRHGIEALIATVPGFGPLIAGGMELAARAIGKTKTSVDDLGDGFVNAAEQIKTETDALNAGVDAVTAYTQSLDGVKSARKGVTDAAGAQARKEDDVAKAVRDGKNATEDLARAEENLAEARRQAPLDLAKAKETEAEATHSIADATDDLAVAVARYGSQSRQAQDAADKLATAKLNQAEAEDKLNQLQRNAAHPVAVQDAERQVADAKERQAAAAQAKTKADQEDPIAEQAAATDKLAQAEEARDKAWRNIQTEVDKVNEALNTQFTVQDAIDGKLKDQLGLVQKIRDDAAAAAASVKDIIANIPAASQGVASVISGAGSPAPPPTTGAGAVGSVIQGVPTITNNWYIQNPVDPQGTADAVTWQQRSRGLN